MREFNCAVLLEIYIIPLIESQSNSLDPSLSPPLLQSHLINVKISGESVQRETLRLVSSHVIAVNVKI